MSKLRCRFNLLFRDEALGRSTSTLHEAEADRLVPSALHRLVLFMHRQNSTPLLTLRDHAALDQLIYDLIRDDRDEFVAHLWISLEHLHGFLLAR